MTARQAFVAMAVAVVVAVMMAVRVRAAVLTFGMREIAPVLGVLQHMGVVIGQHDVGERDDIGMV